MIDSADRFDAEKRKRWVEIPYPCTIVADRYTGVYSGGRWIAYPLHLHEIPLAVEGDDDTCVAFWWDHNANDRLIPVGRGDTPMAAYDDLEAVMTATDPGASAPPAVPDAGGATPSGD